MINYLYYKLYQAALKSSLNDIPHIAASCWLSGLISLNIIMINAVLTKTISFHFIFSNNKATGWFVLLLIISLILFFCKKKRIYIIEKYSGESNKQRVRGNTMVAIYVALTVILTLIIPFYKPGRL